jgi:glycosyltransferase involved in cell wall biosynthesis
MPGTWPEPFRLVAIESLACGTPVLARRVGGLDEIIRDGLDGFFGDDPTELAFNVDRVAELDRVGDPRVRRRPFLGKAKADGYEALYARMLEGPARGSGESERMPEPVRA